MKNSTLNKLLILGSLIVLGFIGLTMSVALGDEVEDPTPIPLSSYEAIDIRELESYADDHVDEFVVVEGEVFSIDTNRLQMWGDDKTSLVITYPSRIEEEQRFYEDDWIRVYGVVKGYQTGKNAFGAELSNPEIRAQIIEKIDEESGRFSEGTNQDVAEGIIEDIIEEATEVTAEESTEEATRIVEDSTPSPSPTIIPETPEIGSRENPHPMGASASMKSDNQIEFDLTVLEVLRGEEAMQRVLEANSFNEPAVEGSEYVMVKMAVDYSGPDAGALEISEYDLELVSHGRVYESGDVEQACCIQPTFDMELLQGGYGEGWIAWQIPPDPEMTLKLGPIFFALYEDMDKQ